jgi:hypothetical protein
MLAGVEGQCDCIGPLPQVGGLSVSRDPVHRAKWEISSLRPE